MTWILWLLEIWNRNDDDWRHVPPPNWACRRGGVDYL